MPTIYDDEFGKITIRRQARSRQVKISLAPDNSLRATLPRYTPLYFVKRLVDKSRPQLRDMLATHHKKTTYHDGMEIGKRHHLAVRSTTQKLQATTQNNSILVSLPPKTELNDTAVVTLLKKEIGKILRKEATAYLPDRLAHLSAELDISYQRVRLSHASTRWGSCSSLGTISLNIALMKLPYSLIDYVIIHELCHRIHMNHSTDFWQLVERYDPDYREHRKALRDISPTI